MTATVEHRQGHESFVVRNIHCSRCAETLHQTIQGLLGVTRTGGDPITGWTWIDYDCDLVSGQELLDAIQAGGYEIVTTWN